VEDGEKEIIAANIYCTVDCHFFSGASNLIILGTSFQGETYHFETVPDVGFLLFTSSTASSYQGLFQEFREIVDLFQLNFWSNFKYGYVKMILTDSKRIFPINQVWILLKEDETIDNFA
jgi:hypothetical protein